MSAIRREDLLAKLASVVGEERAAEIVDDAGRAIGARSWGPDTMERVLDRLAQTQGAIGVTVRLLRTRARATQGRGPQTGSYQVVVEAPNLRKLVEMLAASLGDEKAEALVHAVLARRSIPHDVLPRDQALLVLEDLTGEPGLVGTVARFAKARAHLELVDE